ncbi:hypothetical protein [Modestobacter sp. NPDC049651]|uniref:hypothetical protein n=1 Tax=unclassified Modestobacter TaxID=2643866 RepID=UPI0033C3B569
MLVPVHGERDRVLVDRATRFAGAVLEQAPPAAGTVAAHLEATGPAEHVTPRSAPGAAWFVLTTPGDSPRDWLRAGEALERVLLEVVRHGWQAAPFSRPTEVPAARTLLQEGLTGDLHPQVLVRVGRADPVEPAPRRRAVDVVEDRTCFPAPPGAT